MAHKPQLKGTVSNRGKHKKKVKQGGKTLEQVLEEVRAKAKLEGK